ncbi:MAG TPA: hypothetical protein VND99_01030 [Candidatus Acidoferrales bacterium]|nr:hypothetical protein [Candidatus Acidoferrales bacterium]
MKAKEAGLYYPEKVVIDGRAGATWVGDIAGLVDANTHALLRTARLGTSMGSRARTSVHMRGARRVGALGVSEQPNGSEKLPQQMTRRSGSK